MQTTTLKILGATFLGIALASCGGGDGSALYNIQNSSISSGGTTGGSNSSAIDTTSPQKIGNGESASFVEGAIGINTSTTLSAGGMAVLTINIVSGTNNLVTTPIEVTFNSPCVSSSAAILQTGNIATNKVTATNGTASITYRANGCVGPDAIAASAKINNKVVNANLLITVNADTVQSVEFEDTKPNKIGLKGGGNETSLIRFRVLGSTGAPIKDKEVTFALSTTIGGMSITNTTGMTDIGGHVSTTVQAGTIPTAVRVTATEKATHISTTSSDLIIASGLADEKSTSLSIANPFPISWETDNIETSLSISLADAYNNPPSFTNVYFTTEGGKIDSGCFSDINGQCSVKWRSANPRPTRNSQDESIDRMLCVNPINFPVINPKIDVPWVLDLDACRKERAGRITVKAAAIGNESFIDINGNGLYDKGIDQFNNASNNGDCSPNVPVLSAETPSNSANTPCDDLGEAYLDKNENGIHDANEAFDDTSSPNLDGSPDQKFTEGNGIYNGVLCTEEAEKNNECSRKPITIRQDLLIVMTSYHIMKRDEVLPFIKTTLSGLGDSTLFLLADINGHGIGAGSTLSIDAANLKNGTAGLSNKGPLPGSQDPLWISTTLVPAEGKIASGSYNIVITTPLPNGGSWTTLQTISIN
jgi:hypothetical protein